MKKSYGYLLLFLLGTIFISANAATVLKDSWGNVVNGKCSDQNAAWWSSAEALRIANNVLLYQKDCGGWTKNVNMQLVLTDAQKAALIADKPKNTEATIDNNACVYELLYLSKVYKAISSDSIKNLLKASFTKGISYYLKAQYANGGWPQFYPLKSGYYTHITYNDNAMINVMNNLRHVYLKDSYYSIILSDSIANLARTAFDKGVNCILKTQYVQINKLTTWCAQHHEKTLAPVMARSYELASLSGAESANILKLLMSLTVQTKAIKRAIYSGVVWYDEVRIKGQRLETFTNSEGLSDKRVVADATAADMWARFYTLADNRPFFCDRDGIMKYSLAEIGYERRNGYSWYSTSGNDVMSNYNSWLKVNGTTIIASPLPNSVFRSTDTIPLIAFANRKTGNTLKKFDLIIDNQLINPTTFADMKIPLAGLPAGNHEIIVKSEFTSGLTESDTCNIVVEMPNAITLVPENNSSLLKCYTDLSANSIVVDLPGKTMTSVDLINIHGQTVLTVKPDQPVYRIDTERLKTGIFIIHVKDNSGNQYIQKIIIQ